MLSLECHIDIDSMNVLSKDLRCLIAGGKFYPLSKNHSIICKDNHITKRVNSRNIPVFQIANMHIFDINHWLVHICFPRLNQQRDNRRRRAKPIVVEYQKIFYEKIIYVCLSIISPKTASKLPKCYGTLMTNARMANGQLKPSGIVCITLIPMTGVLLNTIEMIRLSQAMHALIDQEVLDDASCDIQVFREFFFIGHIKDMKAATTRNVNFRNPPSTQDLLDSVSNSFPFMDYSLFTEQEKKDSVFVDFGTEFTMKSNFPLTAIWDLRYLEHMVSQLNGGTTMIHNFQFSPIAGGLKWVNSISQIGVPGVVSIQAYNLIKKNFYTYGNKDGVNALPRQYVVRSPYYNL